MPNWARSNYRSVLKKRSKTGGDKWEKPPVGWPAPGVIITYKYTERKMVINNVEPMKNLRSISKKRT